MSEFHSYRGNVDDEFLFERIYDWKTLKRIWKYFSPYKVYIIASLLILPLIAVLQLSQPYIIKLVIDEHIVQRELKGINLLAFIFLGTLMGQYFLTFVQQYILQFAGQKVI